MFAQDITLIRKGLEALARYELGKKLIEFNLPNLEGVDTGPKDFRGEYLLVDFWASWCGSCRLKHREWMDLYDNRRGYNILSVSTDEDRATWVQAVKRDGVQWPNVIDENNRVATKLGIVGVPINFLLDPNGRIIAMNVELDEIDSLIHQKASKR